MMTINDATDSAADGTALGQIKARLTVESKHRSAAFLEIALLALCEAARCTEDETDEQDAIDTATRAVADAMEMNS